MVPNEYHVKSYPRNMPRKSDCKCILDEKRNIGPGLFVLSSSSATVLN
jgi:hypothetical protein